MTLYQLSILDMTINCVSTMSINNYSVIPNMSINCVICDMAINCVQTLNLPSYSVSRDLEV